MKIVILNGGKGTRLGLRNRPKPMVPIGGRPLLERLLDVGIASGFRDFVFLNGYLSETIEEHFEDGARWGVRIEHMREAVPRGTAGAVRDARALLTEPFIVLYGDLLIDVDLAHFAEFHRSAGAIGTLFVHPNDHPYDSDLVEVDRFGRIMRFLSKPHADGQLLPNLVSGAVYVLDPAVIEDVPENAPSDWGHDVFPAILAAGRPLHAYRSLEYAKDIGTPARLVMAEEDLLSGRVAARSRRNAKPAVFLDRDGVLNSEINGVHRPEDLTLLPGAATALHALNRAGLPAICVTNQPDVAKGLLSNDTLTQIFAALDTALAKDTAYLDAVYVCPHHPERGWRGEVESLKIDCACRKPKPGLLLMAAADHHIDLANSWMIGDRYADVAAARAAGCKAVLVLTGHGGSDSSQFNCIPDFVANNVSDAVGHILQPIT